MLCVILVLPNSYYYSCNHLSNSINIKLISPTGDNQTSGAEDLIN